jgi:membrane protein DedA with SNARE-associated domain
LESLLQWVSTYGYVAIFSLLLLGIVGLPVPDEVLLVFSGYLVYKGRLIFPGVIAAGILGSMCGITVSYLLGRNVGLPLLHTKAGRWTHITDAQIHNVHDWFHRLGHWALFMGYYIPGVRHFTALVAGTSQLEWRQFALYAYSGAVVWVCTFVTLGYHFGEQWQTVLHDVERHLRLAFIALAIVALAYLAYRKLRRR